MEKEYNTSYGTYKPDITVLTTNNETIYIEIANTNKKKLKDFIDIWKELNDIVAEVEVRDMINGNKIEVMNAIYYHGKEYHEQLKELRTICDKEKEKYKFTKDQVDKIDWLIDDIVKYNNGMIEIDQLSDEIQAIEDEDLRKLVVNIVKNKKCGNILDDCVKYYCESTIVGLKNKYPYLSLCDITYEQERFVYDRLFEKFIVNIKYNKTTIVFSSPVKYYSKNLLSTLGLFRNRYMYIGLNEYTKEKYNLELKYYSDYYELEGIKIFPQKRLYELKNNVDEIVLKIKNINYIKLFVENLNKRLQQIYKHDYYCEFIVSNNSYYDYKFILSDNSLDELLFYIRNENIEVKINTDWFKLKTIFNNKFDGDIHEKILFISTYVSNYIRNKKYNITKE